MKTITDPLITAGKLFSLAIVVAVVALLLAWLVGYLAVEAFLDMYEGLYPALGNAIHPDEHTP